MTVKLRKLKSQPLLSPPGEDESPWLEINSKQMEAMTRHFHDLMKSRNWEYFTVEAEWRSTLGIDVTHEVGNHAQEIREHLSSLAVKRDWSKFMKMAANMKRLGLDVGGDVRPHKREITECLRRNHPLGVNYADFTPELSHASEIGLDVKKQAQEHEPGIRKLLTDYSTGFFGAGRWREYAAYAVEMKRLGLDVTDDVKKYEIQVKQELSKCAEWDWGPFTSHAAAMAEVGLLTKKTEEPKKPTPPLKKFGK